VAQRLLEESIRWAKDHRISDIYLGTTAQFLAAHRFYAKNGFLEIAKTDLPVPFPIMAVDSKFYHYRFA
jgi:GNAT superfamily N-acetyltransferase